jgi:hypothetical protein
VQRLLCPTAGTTTAIEFAEQHPTGSVARTPGQSPCSTMVCGGTDGSIDGKANPSATKTRRATQIHFIHGSLAGFGSYEDPSSISLATITAVERTSSSMLPGAIRRPPPWILLPVSLFALVACVPDQASAAPVLKIHNDLRQTIVTRDCANSRCTSTDDDVRVAHGRASSFNLNSEGIRQQYGIVDRGHILGCRSFTTTNAHRGLVRVDASTVNGRCH